MLPKKQILMYQISFYVPKASLEVVKNAMFAEGAGRFNNYQDCAWQTIGSGQFKPIGNANPAIGCVNETTIIQEYKVEMMCEDNRLCSVIKAMKLAHPYEQIAYSVIKIENL